MTSANTKTLAAQLAARRAAANGTTPSPTTTIEHAPVVVELKPEALSRQRERSLFEQYVEHGFKLCPIRSGEKSPRGAGWNKRENAIDTPKHAEHLANAGLLHAFSGTCALDLDNVALARVYLREKGIDLTALYNADDAVQIVSGDATRGKLIYALSEPLPTKKILNEDKTICVLELRCGATTGNSVQDVCPPSMNPRTGIQYQWVGDWRKLPPLPESLRQLWQSMVAPKVERTAVELQPSAEVDELRKLIAGKDPDSSYDEWCRIGMVLHHETGGSDAGLAVWDEWSQQGSKYAGTSDLESHWNSFGNAANPATAGSLRREAVATLEQFGPAPNQDVLAEAERETQHRAHDKRISRARAVLAHPRDGDLALRFVEYSVDNFLARLTVLSGAAGIGKTTLIVPLSAAVAHLVKYEGIEATLPRNVLYFSEDPDQVERILYGVRKHAPGAASDAEFRKRFKVYEAQRETPENLAALFELACAEHTTNYNGYTVKPLLVFDTVNATFEIAEENSNDDWGRALQPLKNALGDNGPCWLIHHLPKALEGITDIDKLVARGAGALIGAAHTTGFLVAAPLLGPDVRLLGTKKVRFEHGGFDMVKFATTTAFEQVSTPWGEPQHVTYRYGTPSRYSRAQRATDEGVVEKLGDAKKGREFEGAVITALVSVGLPVSGRDLRGLVSGDDKEIDAARDRLVEQGTVIAEARKRRGGGTDYRLADSHERGWWVRGNPDAAAAQGAHLLATPDPDSDLLGEADEYK